ncbi:hypothetical protein [Pseudopontixanthobacter vadosimaris]
MKADREDQPSFVPGCLAASSEPLVATIGIFSQRAARRAHVFSAYYND